MALDLRLRKNNEIVLLDIIVTKKRELRAYMPMYESNTLIPLTEKERQEFFKTVNPKRIHNRILGNLRGRSLTRAKHLLNAALGNMPAESIEIKQDIELGSLHLFLDDWLRIV